MKAFIRRVLNPLLFPFGMEVSKFGRNATQAQKLLTTNDEPVILDGGSYIGDTCQKYLKNFPKGTIHCFEPFEGSYKRLQERFGSHPAVTINRMALGDHDGELNFYSNAFAPTNSSLAADPKSSDFWGENLYDNQAIVKVPATTIDSYLEKRNVLHVDILKLDLQGGELSALHGAEKSLKAKKINLVFMEMIHAPTYVGQPKFEEYLQFMDSCGYGMMNMYNFLYSNHRLIKSDIIFLPQEKL